MERIGRGTRSDPGSNPGIDALCFLMAGSQLASRQCLGMANGDAGRKHWNIGNWSLFATSYCP